MARSRIILALAVVTGLFGSPAVHADAGTPLTPAVAARTVAVLQDLKTIGLMDGDAATAPLADLQAKYVVERHGFSPAGWRQIVGRVKEAHSALLINERFVHMRSELELDYVRRSVRESLTMTFEEKRAAIIALDIQSSTLRGENPDIEVLKPYLNHLNEAFSVR